MSITQSLIRDLTVLDVLPFQETATEFRVKSDRSYYIGAGGKTITKPVRMEAGAKFTGPGALVINAQIIAPSTYIFQNSGGVSGTFGGQPVEPYWWGVATDGTTASDSAMLSAIAAAAAASVELQGRGKRIVFSGVSNRVGGPTGDGLYKWRDFELYCASTSNGPIIDMRQDTVGVAATLSVDAAVGAHGVTVSDDSALVVGRRYVLISKAFYKGANGANYSNKSEYVTLQAKAAGVLTFYNYLTASYAVADGASLFDATYGHVIDFENIKFTRVGATGTRDGFYATYCDVKNVRNCSADSTGVWGMLFRKCSFSGEVSGYAANNPSGYGFGSVGSDNPKFGAIVGKKMRHTLTVDGETSTTNCWSIGGTLVGATGRGGYARSIHCDDAENSIFDMHANHFGFHVGNVTGRCRQDASVVTGVTLESADVTIESISVSGGSTGLSIQCYGKASDEELPYYKIGFLRSLGVSSAILVVQNRDSTNHLGLNVHVGYLIGKSSLYAISLNSGVASDEGGDIFMTYDRIDASASGSTGITFTTSAYGRIECVGYRCDLRQTSGNAAHYPVFANGATYTAAFAGVIGAKFKCELGKFYRTYSGAGTNYIFRTIDGLVEIGSGVTFSYDTGTVAIWTGSSTGGIKGAVDKAVETISTNAAFTLTPFQNAEYVKHTGTLTADRALTLSTQSAVAGQRFRVTRTGSGAFNITNALKNLATNTWADFIYDGSAWYLAAYGAL